MGIEVAFESGARVWVTRIVGTGFAVCGVLLFLYDAFGIGRVLTN